MPLREDLLEPVAGPNPSGANLYYDKVFDQIKEARTEDVEVGSAGAWERAAKKADHVTVIKLAGETLAKRTKDLRLAGWLAEAHLRREGITLLAPGLELVWKLQETFWESLYPEIDEDGSLDLRVSAIESAVTRLATHLRNAPITKAGYSATQYTDSRRLGYEAAADTSEKQKARQDAIDHGQLTAEDFDIGFEGTKKAFYVETEASLERAASLIEEISVFHEEKYGDDYPNLGKLTTAVNEVKQIVSALLNERRKTDPDAVVEAEPEPEPEMVEEAEPEPVYVAEVAVPKVAAPKPQAKAAGFAGVPTSAEQAYAAVLAGAMFLHEENPLSPVPYLVCAGLRLGETRREGAYPASDFPVAPATETRQTIRRLANESGWAELMKLCLRTLTEPCGRTWLDLQRYTWRAAKELGAEATAAAVVATVAGVLKDLPEMRGWTLDDDTPVGNAETQQWVDAEILPPPPAVEEPQAVEEPVSFAPLAVHAEEREGVREPELYDTAVELLQRGQPTEAIRLLVRDAQLQPSGRERFKRRVQVAQLCLMAERDAVAFPVLQELSEEIDRRGLETWETGEMLAHPLSLLLTCMERRNGSPEKREALFERLCRLDPQAALAVRS